MTDPVTLPHHRAVRTDKIHFVDFGGQLKPFMGGPVQTIMRLGSRWTIEFTVPPMLTEPLGRIWGARLVRAKIFGALMRWRQDGLVVGLPGSPVVDGGGQTGFTLALRGFRPGYAIREGQMFSLVSQNRRYLYMAAGAMVADSAGRVALPIAPMLRTSPIDGDTAEFAAPMIQGSLSGNEVAWQRLTAPYCDFGTITISEDE